MVLNVAVTQTNAESFLTVYPTGGPRPVAANLNYVAGDTVSNRVMAKLGTGGSVTIFNNAGTTDVVVDVGGWYTDELSPRTRAPMPPSPLPGSSTPATARVACPDAVAANTQCRRPAHRCGRRARHGSDRGNPQRDGDPARRPGLPHHLADRHCSAAGLRPQLRHRRDPAESGGGPVGTGGKVNLYTSTTTHVVFDVAGWFS